MSFSNAVQNLTSIARAVVFTVVVLLIALISHATARAQTAVPILPGFPSTTGYINTIVGSYAEGCGYVHSSTPLASALICNPTGLAVDKAGNLYISTGPVGQQVYKVDAQTDTVSPYAGGGNATVANGLPASSVSLQAPYGLTCDASGNLYIVDEGANQIYKVDQNTQNIYIYAGTGTSGYSGDGGQASLASLSAPFDMKFDTAGNAYVADTGNNVIRKVDSSTNEISTIVGNQASPCGDPTTPCGDGSPAVDAQLGYPTDVAVDSKGNLYIADNADYRIREVSAQTGVISTIAGNGQECTSLPCGIPGAAASAQIAPYFLALDSTGNLFMSYFDGNSGNYEPVIYELDAKTGNISTFAGTYSTNGFSGDGGPAIDALFNNVQALAFDQRDDLYIADQNNNVVRGVTGNVTPVLQSQTVSFNGLPASVTYGVSPIILSATASSGLPVTFKYISGPATLSGSTLTITGAGTVTVEADQNGDSSYSPASAKGTITVSSQQLTITAPTLSLTAGEAIPTLTPTYSGWVGKDSGSGSPTLTVSDANGNVYAPGSIPPVGSYTITVTIGSFTAGSNYTVELVNGSLSVTGGAAQTITFNALPNVTYGAAPIALFASASSGLPITFSFTGPASLSGSTLTITGAGTISVTATQAGNGSYAAASVSHSFQVSQAVLTVAANNQSRAYGLANPALTYSISGFASGDTTSVVQGVPNLTTTANSTSAPGNYPIAVDVTPLSATNYTFTPFNGTLTVNVAAQTITFTPAAVSSMTYGSAVAITATSNSVVPITYTSTGPIQLANQQWIATGVGTATIIASQAGNADYTAATASISFPVVPAVLTVAANNMTRGFGQQNPTFTYRISGFLNGDGDTSNVLTGAPDITTTATQTSATGLYSIIPSQDTLTAPNYTFAFVNGQLTVTGAPSYTIVANPSLLNIQRGQTAQTTIVVTPINLYQGSIALSCGQLPANVTCTFSPATLTLDGSGNPVQGTLTVNTNASAPVVSANATSSMPTGQGQIQTTAIFLLPGAFAGLFLCIKRRRFTKNGWLQLSLLLALLIGASSLVACGGSSSGSGVASVGSSTVVVSATGTGTTGTGNPDVSNTLNLTINITQ
jgi:hypothetical protein